MKIDATLYSGRPAEKRIDKEERCYDLLEKLGIEFCRRLSAGNSICNILCGSCSICTGNRGNQRAAALIQTNFLVIFCKETVIRAGTVLGNRAGSSSNCNGGIHQLQRNESSPD